MKWNDPITFDELINQEWLKVYEADGAGAEVSNPSEPDMPMGVSFIMPTVWDEFYPITHKLNEEDRTKLFNIFFYAKEMYKYMRPLEDNTAKELINKINTEEFVAHKFND